MPELQTRKVWLVLKQHIWGEFFSKNNVYRRDRNHKNVWTAKHLIENHFISISKQPFYIKAYFTQF